MGYHVPNQRLRPTAQSRLSASLWGLSALFIVSLVVFVGLGQHPTTPLQTLTLMLHKTGVAFGVPTTTHQADALFGARLPRAVMCTIVGTALSIAGTVTQGVFRNPLADPGLLGASSGAALATACATWLVDPWVHPILGAIAKPALATCGALATILAVYFLSRRRGTVLVATMMLAGLAINALAFALVGCVTYMAAALHIRQLSLWSLGSFGASCWSTVGATFVCVAAACALLPMLWRPLDAMLLGEGEARHLGIDTRRTKIVAVVVVALTTGAAVAAVGFIGFVGLFIPHLSRLLVGAQHRLLLPAAALMGSSVLLAMDALARTLAPPAELPVGLLTALVGAPFLLWLLIGERSWSRI